MLARLQPIAHTLCRFRHLRHDLRRRIRQRVDAGPDDSRKQAEHDRRGHRPWNLHARHHAHRRLERVRQENPEHDGNQHRLHVLQQENERRGREDRAHHGAQIHRNVGRDGRCLGVAGVVVVGH